ncbi:hypothetical protein [Chryseobacterium taeanense]|uniref:hypothetical protein n=1 Tax=Chryseobacterium taeanense TaxID=311334 RepID=UPI0035B4305D
MFKIQAQSNIPTDFGMFTVYAFSENKNDWSPHLVLVSKKTNFNELHNDVLAYQSLKLLRSVII